MDSHSTPYIDNAGNVIVPFNADPKYHFWNGGQSLSKTLLEIKANENTWDRHIEKPYPRNEAQ